MRCRFCDSTTLVPRHRGVAHPRRREHGPFDLYACITCGSLGTWPQIDKAALAALYGAFASGVDAKLRDLRDASPLTAWFERVVDRAAQFGHLSPGAAFRWLDVGAGGGELAAALARRFPHAAGRAVDWAARPDGLDPRVDWQIADLNEPFPASLGQAKLVVSLSVWEHVLEPSTFVERLLPLVAPGGLLYLVCPDAGSVAYRALGRRWPYFLPGEHLNMPTRAGARRCLERLAPGHDIRVATIGLPYPPAYVLGFLGLDRVARWAQRLPSVPLPVGALETVCKRPNLS
ncbi:MAG: methyltransferase domain-containing protein [Kofleriaceae bacterium]|nr:methyltransferase domain-containing protein [Kofleriaceae bacterium]